MYWVNGVVKPSKSGPCPCHVLVHDGTDHSFRVLRVDGQPILTISTGLKLMPSRRRRIARGCSSRSRGIWPHASATLTLSSFPLSTCLVRMALNAKCQTQYMKSVLRLTRYVGTEGTCASSHKMHLWQHMFCSVASIYVAKCHCHVSTVMYSRFACQCKSNAVYDTCGTQDQCTNPKLQVLLKIAC
jgi:hypothetical protein